MTSVEYSRVEEETEEELNEIKRCVNGQGAVPVSQY